MIYEGQELPPAEMHSLLRSAIELDKTLMTKVARQAAAKLIAYGTFWVTPSSTTLWEAMLADEDMTSTFTSSWNTDYHAQNIMPTISLLPHQMHRQLISAVKKHHAMVSLCFLHAYTQAITKDDATGLIPQDLPALIWIVKKQDGIVPPDRMGTYLGNIRLNICRHKNLDSYVGMLSELTDTICEQHRHHILPDRRKRWGLYLPQATYHRVAASCKTTPQDILAKALLFLSKSRNRQRIKLNAPFTIPADTTGANLCRLLCYLASHTKITPGNLHGIPTQEELAARAIETQINDHALFAAAANARDILQAHMDTGQDYTTLLQDGIRQLLDKHPGVETQIIRKGLRHGIQPEELAALTRLTAGIDIQSNKFDEKKALWGHPLTERTARRLWQALATIGLAPAQPSAKMTAGGNP